MAIFRDYPYENTTECGDLLDALYSIVLFKKQHPEAVIKSVDDGALRLIGFTSENPVASWTMTLTSVMLLKGHHSLRSDIRDFVQTPAKRDQLAALITEGAPVLKEGFESVQEYTFAVRLGCKFSDDLENSACLYMDDCLLSVTSGKVYLDVSRDAVSLPVAILSIIGQANSKLETRVLKVGPIEGEEGDQEVFDVFNKALARQDPDSTSTEIQAEVAALLKKAAV